MAGGAGIGKQLWRRLVLIEILRDGRWTAQRGQNGKNEKPAARFH
jgi:hypothetical protein